MDAYVARQPIFRKDKRIFAYELLFRGGPRNVFPQIDGDMATSQLVSNSFFSVGIEKITGRKRAFINFTQDLLVKQYPLMLPKEKVVVEVLEDVEPTDDVVGACRDLTAKGYDIALDDFFYASGLRPLIALADVIKVDFRSMTPEEMAACVDKLSHYDVALLAEKVETPEDFSLAVDMGFDYFQGYFFSKPEVLRKKDISSAHMNLLQVMAEASKEGMSFDALEKIISRDVAIPYKLLRYINSAYFRRVQEISSIRQALALLGENETRRFLSLIALAGLASDKPNELIRTSTIRARFCDLMGRLDKGSARPSELFILGLFSLIDALLDESMESLMEKLPLADSIKKALIDKEGDIYPYLDLAVSYERGDWAEVSSLATKLRLEETDLPPQYADAVVWADRLTAM